jgi:hypothetical protein
MYPVLLLQYSFLHSEYREALCLGGQLTLPTLHHAFVG